MKVKSLLVAGTMVAGLGVSVFSLPTHAVGTEITNATFANAAANAGTTYSGVTCNYVGYCEYLLADGEYILGGDVNIDIADALILTGNVSIDFNGHKISGRVDAGKYDDHAANITLSGEGGVAGNLTAYSTLIINGGTYGNSSGDSAALSINDGAKVTINGGAFLSGGAASVTMVNFSEGANLTINGGNFTSADHHGVELILESAASNVEIKSGVFSGKDSGLSVTWAESPIKLSGGTFNGTNAILLGIPEDADAATALAGLLVDGYEYSDTSSSKADGMARLDTTSVTVRAKSTTPTTPAEVPATPTAPSSDKNKVMDEMAAEMEAMIKSGMGAEKVIAKATSNGSVKKTVKAPNTGVADSAVTTEGLTVLTMVALSGLVFLKKKF